MVSAIIYDEDELDPIMERKLALDENRLHQPLPPVDEAIRACLKTGYSASSLVEYGYEYTQIL